MPAYLPISYPETCNRSSWPLKEHHIETTNKWEERRDQEALGRIGQGYLPRIELKCQELLIVLLPKGKSLNSNSLMRLFFSCSSLPFCASLLSCGAAMVHCISCPTEESWTNSICGLLCYKTLEVKVFSDSWWLCNFIKWNFFIFIDQIICTREQIL